MTGRLRRRAVAAAALLGFALSGCGSSPGPAADPTPVPGAATNGRLTIGIPFDQPGIGMKNGGTYSGFDVETAKYVAKALGVPEENITWKESTGDAREAMLAGGEVDLVVSNYTINDRAGSRSSATASRTRTTASGSRRATPRWSTR